MCYFWAVIGYNLSSVASIMYDCLYINPVLYVRLQLLVLHSSGHSARRLPAAPCFIHAEAVQWSMLQPKESISVDPSMSCSCMSSAACLKLHSSNWKAAQVHAAQAGHFPSFNLSHDLREYHPVVFQQ